jgi:hypothetical protein
MPDPPGAYGMFLGEHGWSPASRYFQQPYLGDDGWVQPENGCPVKVRAIAFEYSREAAGFDCSVDESYSLRLPVGELVTSLDLRWGGNDADYVDASGKLAVFDPTANADGPSALLFREDLMEELFARERLTICWAFVGEKRVLGAGLIPEHHPSLRISGAYRLENGKPVGFSKFMFMPKGADPKSRSKLLGTIRCRG